MFSCFVCFAASQSGAVVLSAVVGSRVVLWLDERSKEVADEEERQLYGGKVDVDAVEVRLKLSIFMTCVCTLRPVS